MTTQLFHEAQLVEQRIKQTLSAIKLLEGCKITSIGVRKFDNSTCTFDDVSVSHNIPRQKIKEFYRGHLHNELASLRFKLNRMLSNDQLPIQNGGESLLQEIQNTETALQE